MGADTSPSLHAARSSYGALLDVAPDRLRLVTGRRHLDGRSPFPQTYEKLQQPRGRSGVCPVEAQRIDYSRVREIRELLGVVILSD